MKTLFKLFTLILALTSYHAHALLVSFNDANDGQSSFSLVSDGLTYTFQNPTNSDTSFTLDSNQLLFGSRSQGNSPVDMLQFELVVSGGDGVFSGYTTGSETTSGDVFSITGPNTNNLFDTLSGSTASLSFTSSLMLLQNQVYTFTYDLTANNPTGTGVTGFSAFDLSPSPVPVPAAVWLFGSALLGLVGLGRRKNTR